MSDMALDDSQDGVLFPELPLPALKPTRAQAEYLSQGLEQAGGKLPLFDADGRPVARKVIQACIDHGWAEPWYANPMKADWMVCKLTRDGYVALGVSQDEPEA